MGNRLEIKAGDRYNRMVIIKEGDAKIYPSVGSRRMFKCLCDCGVIKTVNLGSLRSGLTQSCGCLKIEMVKISSTTHGQWYTRQSKIWRGMIQRIKNSKNSSYNYYGGRGVTVDKKWLTFEGFWEDMEEGYSDELSLDRVNNDGNYCKENCRWATKKEQARNTSTNRIIKFNGQEKCITEWSKELGGSSALLYKRINKLGWSIHKSLTTPVR